jgi:hypothetical protein
MEQVHKEAPRILKSQIEVGESSRTKPRVTTRILLNKWQRQQERERYQKQKYEEERRWFEEEARRRELEEHAREQERAHWGCAFFRHCWNEGLKLPTLKNCPECSDNTLNIGNKLSIADPSMKELEGCIPMTVGV